MTDRKEEAVVVTREGAVAMLRLNEPGSLNALSGGVKAGLEANIPRLLADPAVKALVLTGTGRAFCAGGDIRGMDEHDPVATRARMARTHSWLGLLLATETPIVTAVNGLAVGAGLALALVGDVVVAAPQARFKAAFPGLGAVPDLGLCWTLPRFVGSLRAREILLLDRGFDAAEAAAIGLVTSVAAEGQLLAEAVAIATRLAANPLSARLTKTLLRRAFDAPLDAFLDAEASAQAVAFASADFREGVAAFRDKRQARFTGL